MASRPIRASKPGRAKAHAVRPRSSAAPRPTQAARRHASETRLLTAAAELIEAEGFGAVTFERVGSAAGFSRGLAAHKFGSKDGLVQAVIGFVTDRVRARVDSALLGFDDASNPRPTVARILLWTDTMLASVEHDAIFRAYFVMLAAAVGNRADIRTAFLTAHDDVRAQLRAMVEEGQARGEMSPTLDADAVALNIGSLHLGIAVERLLDPAMDMAAMRVTAGRAIGAMLA